MWDKLNGLQRLGHLLISQIWRSALKTQQCILQGGAWDPHRRKALPKGTKGHIWNMIFLSLSFWTGGAHRFQIPQKEKLTCIKVHSKARMGISRLPGPRAAAGAPDSGCPRSPGGAETVLFYSQAWAFQECLSRAGSRLSGGNQAFLPGAPFPSPAWLPGLGILLMGDKAFNSKRSDERLQMQMCGLGSRRDNRQPSK